LVKPTAPAREILRTVLAGRSISTPAPEERVYTFTGERLDRTAPGRAVPAWSRTFNGDGGPNGICHLVGQYLRFSLEGIAMRT